MSISVLFTSFLKHFSLCKNNKYIMRSFAPFVQGSRKCSLQLRTSNLKRLVSVHIVPIAHAATTSFYEGLMTDIDQMRLTAQNNSDDHCDLFTFQGETLYHRHHQAELSKSEKDLLSTKRFVAVVEGASETQAERQMESEEMALIQRHVKMTMCAEDLSAQGMPADMLQESTTFVERYSQAVQSGALYSDEHLKSICEMYQLPFPLPDNLVLQDSFFRPRLAIRHGDCIVNGDVVLDQMQDPSLATTNPSAFHHMREFNCFDTVRKLVRECDSEDITMLVDEEEGELSQRHIAVLWGHFHSPNLLKLFEGVGSDSVSSGFEVVKDELSGGICTFSTDVRSYGWSKEMVKKYYNVEH